jgi:3-hydroxyacyl-[acyl-carrier-protein] dehydratase
MLLEDLDQVLRSLRRGPLLPPGRGTELNLGRSAVECLLPHRPPFLFIDQVQAVDLESRSLRASHYVDPADPVFVGHFPGDPVLPGVLAVEAMGQAAVALHYFLREQSLTVPEHFKPTPLRATRIHHAGFFRPIFPGHTMILHAKALHDEFTLIVGAQAFCNDELSAIAVMEVLIDA